MNNASLVRKVFALGAIAFASCAGAASAASNSGLDLTRPLDSFSYTYQNTSFTHGTSLDTRTLNMSFTVPHGQFALNTNLNGPSDLGLQYNYVFPSDTRFRQTIGALASFPSGRAYSTNERQTGGLYEMAYDVNNSASVLFLARYTVGTNPAVGAPRYNELTLSPYALLNLPKDTYAALIPSYHSYAGGLHASTYDATLDVGRIFSGYFNASAYYGVPLGQYSYLNLYRHSYGVKLGIQL